MFIYLNMDIVKGIVGITSFAYLFARFGFLGDKRINLTDVKDGDKPLLRYTSIRNDNYLLFHSYSYWTMDNIGGGDLQYKSGGVSIRPVVIEHFDIKGNYQTL